ncbi:hypothetical protein [Phenylobacterium sp.]|jgi:hypothetical protein|uniref:hypothetical protein n=1 Tax=Phenylobacterium sp. TaxID=1871053 RepID=UPI002E34E3CB|nr:hypothetical protein [Phenylobacterium sp.]HEX2561713.1 hypothetical protein [Phenylobacterium sp.]
MADHEFFQFQLRPAPGRESQAAFAGDLKDRGAGSVRAAGGEPLGLFSSQLGWAASELALLVRWGERGRADLAGLAGVEAVRREALTPTIRPAAGDALRPGGIHVLRWFHVLPDSAEAFVMLSGEGWADFETRFDARVFGLFRAPDEASVARFLLITRYGDHGEWERSRDPSTAAMQTFMRRQQLTVWTQAASTLLSVT